MKIIIDIPQGLKIDFENENWTVLTCAEMKNALINGTKLPEGHGDLVDRSEVIKSLFDYHKGKKTLGQCIDDVQTIIEADKES